MSYNTLADFDAALRAGWPEQAFPAEDVRMYFEWYKLAKAQERIVLGREKDLQQVISKYGRAGTGGAMLIGVKTWNIWVNDSWILGGIHAHIPFYLFAETAKNWTYDAVYNEAQAANADPTRVLFVTTREITGLNLSGYQMTDAAHPDGKKFDCTQPVLADNASFKEYREHARAVGMAARS